MKELQSIVDAAAEAERTGVQTLLATVVQVEGSTYRRPGAHLLVTEDGRHAGSISGGCLERDLVERARTLTRTGTPALVMYNTTDDDLVFGFATGCRGVVRILVERPGRDGRPDPVAFIRECLRRGRPGLLATVYQVEGSVGVMCGERVFLSEDGDATVDIRNADLKSRVVGDAQDALALGRCATKSYSLTSGAARVFFDVIRPPVSLAICGAGRDALPVVRMARELGWHVTVADWRPALATPESVPLAHEIVLSSAGALPERVLLERCDAVLVMTHNYLQDRALLAQLLPSPVPYIGVLGPRTRTHQLLLELQSQGVVWTEPQLARVHAPVGLDIGAEEPETIALPILAEIQAVLAAGASTRYGQPKQLLYYEGRSLLRRAAEAVAGSVCRPIVVVLGASATSCADEVRGLPVHLTENATWMKGMGDSLRAGIEAASALAPAVAAVVVVLCDQPLVSPQIINALAQRYRESGAPIVASAYAGTLGVPALFDRSLFEQLLALNGGDGARRIIEQSKRDVEAIPFPDGIVDIDTPQDYALLRRFAASSGPTPRLSRGAPCGDNEPAAPGARRATYGVE